MGTKKIIGYYRYNPNRPSWAVNLGGVMQGLSFFWGFCAICCLVFFFQSIQYGTISTFYLFLGFLALVALVVFNQIVGKRLAIGKNYHPRLPFTRKECGSSTKASQPDPAIVELVSKLRARGIPDKDIFEAVRATMNDGSLASVAKHLDKKAVKK